MSRQIVDAGQRRSQRKSRRKSQRKPQLHLGRSLLALLAVCAMVIAGLAVGAPSASAATATTTDKGVQYSYNDANLANGATATGYTGTATTVKIPGSITIKGSSVTVVSIANGAFQGGKLETVTIGNNVTSIGANAFAGNQLVSVTLGSSVAKVGDSSFGSNPKLQFVTLTGPVPTVTAAGAKDSQGNPTESFDTSASPVVQVRYQQIYEKSWMYPDGFAFPKWRGYTTLSPPTSWCTPKPFNDVNSGNMFCNDIGWTKLQRIADGYSDGGFHPGASISRQAMAAFLYRFAKPGAKAPSCGASPFNDVVGTTFCGEIQWLNEQDVSFPYSDGGFHPKAAISRQAVAAQLYRLTNPGKGDASCPAQRPFKDVGSGNQFCGDIAWMADRNITNGYGDGGFHPRAPVTGQAMAAFLHRANSLSP